MHIAFNDKFRRSDDHSLVAYTLGVIQSLITGVNNSLIDSTAPPGFPPRRIVINPDNLSVPPGHKPYDLSAFGAEGPFTIIRAETAAHDASGRLKFGTDLKKRLPAGVAAPGLAMLTLASCLVGTLLKLSKHYGDLPGPWLDNLRQSFTQRTQDLRTLGFSESDKIRIIRFALSYTLAACDEVQKDIAKNAQAA